MNAEDTNVFDEQIDEMIQRHAQSDWSQEQEPLTLQRLNARLDLPDCMRGFLEQFFVDGVAKQSLTTKTNRAIP